MIKKSVFLICFFFIHAKLSAQKDSLARPAYKIFVNGSFAIVNGWAPKEGRFYSEDWYGNGQEPPTSRSVAFHGGVLGSVKLFSSSFYFTVGIDMSSYNLNNFRKQPAHDPRHDFPYDTITDQYYSDYTIRSLHIPLYFQIPFIAKRTYLAMRAGVINDYSYSEEYHILNTRQSGSFSESTSDLIKNNGMHYVATRVQFGLDAEFHVLNSRIVPMLSLNLTTAPLSGNQDGYFLHYSSVLSLAFGFGYCFYR